VIHDDGPVGEALGEDEEHDGGDDALYGREHDGAPGVDVLRNSSRGKDRKNPAKRARTEPAVLVEHVRQTGDQSPRQRKTLGALPELRAEGADVTKKKVRA
jgi:hypothetical protein